MNVLRYLKGRRIGVLKGGWSSERSISLKTGAAIERSLKTLGLRFASIDVTRDLAGRLRLKKVNFVFNALHGPVGEDGSVQGLLEVMGIPYTGSGVLASALSMDKVAAKEIFTQHGLPTPRWRVLEGANSAAPRLRLPWVVKPVDQGSAFGVSIVRSRRGFRKAFALARRFGRRVLVEEFIEGRELTVGVLGDQALPVTEIFPDKTQPFYNFKAKYAPGGSRHRCPAQLPAELAGRIRVMALEAFRVLGCRGMGRVDLILGPGRRPSLLEMNSLPGMTETSLLPEAAQAAGYSFSEMLLKIVKHSIQGNG